MIFEPINLGKWPPGPEGKEYVVPADDILRCIAKVEQVVSFFDLAKMRLSGDLKTAQLSQGLAAAMRHAGAQVTDEEVYRAIFSDPKTLPARAWQTLYALESLMIPPEHLRAQEEKAKGKGSRGKRAASSRKSTSS